MTENRYLSIGKYILVDISIFLNSVFTIPALLESNIELGYTLKVMLINSELMNNQENEPHCCDDFCTLQVVVDVSV